jgi:DNA polymerase
MVATAEEALDRAPENPPNVPLLQPAPVPVRAAEEPLPGDWEGLRDRVAGCRKCKLCSTRTQTVFGVGERSAPLMVIGEGPGADEDAKGEPFVGRAGKLLDEMLASIRHSRQRDVYIANVVKCRPPGNRDPEADEVEACRPYLDQQIRLVKPRLIVALGRIAAQRLLQSDQPLSRLRGPQYSYGSEQTPLLLTYRPAYLLRSPREKAKAWDDLKRIERFLRSAP